jgi:hypothetical protein
MIREIFRLSHKQDDSGPKQGKERRERDDEIKKGFQADNEEQIYPP